MIIRKIASKWAWHMFKFLWRYWTSVLLIYFYSIKLSSISLNVFLRDNITKQWLDMLCKFGQQLVQIPISMLLYLNQNIKLLLNFYHKHVFAKTVLKAWKLCGGIQEREKNFSNMMQLFRVVWWFQLAHQLVKQGFPNKTL